MFKTILVPLDGSDLAEEAVGLATSIARASHATLDLLMVHEPVFAGMEDPTWGEAQIVAEQRYLRAIAREIESGAGVSSRQTLVHGQPAELISVRAIDCEADLIVMTSNGRTGWSRAWLGSVADAVVRASNTPVLMLRPMRDRLDRRAMHEPLRRIVVPLDGSAVSAEILPTVRDLARCWSAEVDLVRIVEPVPMITPTMEFPMYYMPIVPDATATEEVRQQAASELERTADELRGNGVSVGHHQVVTSTKPAQSIVDFARAREANLIALGTHGRGRSRLLIGSVADKVRHATDLPVLLYRARFARVAQPKLSARSVTEQLPAMAGEER